MAGGIVLTPPRRAENLAHGLALFSLGLGTAKLLAPARLARLTGLAGRETLVRTYGVREIGAGVGLLNAGDRSVWLWARLGGDALDLATLIVARRSTCHRGRIWLAMTLVGGVTALDAAALVIERRQSPDETTIIRAITIGLGPDPILDLLRQPGTLARLAGAAAQATAHHDGSSHWVLHGPGRRSIMWTMSPVEQLGDRLRWQARRDGTRVRTLTAHTRPASSGRGTVLTLELQLAPSSTITGRAAPALLDGAVARTLLDTGLHRFKSLAETGEIPTTNPQPAARGDTR